jgi:hypothetical protein
MAKAKTDEQKEAIGSSLSEEVHERLRRLEAHASSTKILIESLELKVMVLEKEIAQGGSTASGQSEPGEVPELESELPEGFKAEAAMNREGNAYKVVVRGPVNAGSKILLARNGNVDTLDPIGGDDMIVGFAPVPPDTTGVWTAILEHDGVRYRIDAMPFVS